MNPSAKFQAALDAAAARRGVPRLVVDPVTGDVARDDDPTRWEAPARELLGLLSGAEITNAEAANLRGDVLAALEDLDVPEEYR